MGNRDELYSQVCNQLAGKPVVWRFVQPVIGRARGLAYLDKGKACIDIRPGLPESDALWVTLHELAHVRLNHCHQLPAYLAAAKTTMDYLPAVAAKIENLPREAEADSQAATWLKYADDNYQRFEGDSTFDRKLKALLTWRDQRELDLINRAVKAAFQHLGLEEK